MAHVRVAIVGGTGALGLGLAVRLARAGVEVVIGSRSDARAREAEHQVLHAVPSALARGAIWDRAADAGEVVVIAVPAAAQEATIRFLAPHLQGKVVVDATVSLDPSDPTSAAPPPEGSCALRARTLLPPEVGLVAAFHTLSGRLLADVGRPVTADALLCGDDPEAKETVAGLCERMGIRPVDVGPLAKSVVLEALTGILIGLNRRYRRRHVGVRFTGLSEAKRGDGQVDVTGTA